MEDFIPGYIEALCQELRFVSRAAQERLPVYTLFFGGGTPSLLPINAFEKVFVSIRECFLLAKDAEITIEANPGTLSLPYLHDLFSLGVNRLSLGMQSGTPDDLRLLERQHDLSAVVQSVYWARKAGFDQINLDLIFGIPYQTLESWMKTLQMAMNLIPEHLSLYALSLEHGTPLMRWVSRGLVSAPDDDLAADMYELAEDYLEKAGYIQYEISNWAQRDSQGRLLACLHNLQYWRSLPYLGFGAGAHGFANQMRIANVLSPAMYIQRFQGEMNSGDLHFPASPAAVDVTVIDRPRAIGEYMMMGLRLVQDGISEEDFQDRFGKSLEDEYGPVIEKLQKKGLVEYLDEEKLLRLTKGGRLLGNQVFCEFI
jgi:oxygen-independent coproporphyrinogen-3 oxidase